MVDFWGGGGGGGWKEGRQTRLWRVNRLRNEFSKSQQLLPLAFESLASASFPFTPRRN